jgi:GntR family histidine utilization transcriptional repressor
VNADLKLRTASEYLLEMVPLGQAEHMVSATLPTPRIARLLKMSPGEPCLLLHRRTWSKGTVASIADLYHPGSRYDLVGRFKP